MRKFGKQLLAGPYLVWIIGFIILPVFAVLYYALTNSAGSFTLENIAAIAEPVHLKALFLALKLAVICTFICLLLSYPLAMILKKTKRFPAPKSLAASIKSFRMRTNAL